MSKLSLAGMLNSIDRWLHPVRRQLALRSLARSRCPDSFLFVCYGNLCRSPYAAKAFERQLRRRGALFQSVESAGFVGPRRGTPAVGVVAAARRSVDLEEHQSRLITQELILKHDLVVVMDATQRRAVRMRHGEDRPVIVLGDLDPDAILTRAIPDPINQPEEAFDESYDRIDRCLVELDKAVERACSSGR